MTTNRGKRFAVKGEPLVFPSIQAAQIAAAADPKRPTSSLFADEPVSPEFAGRPLSVWRADPAIARMINDHLSREAA